MWSYIWRSLVVRLKRIRHAVSNFYERKENMVVRTRKVGVEAFSKAGKCPMKGLEDLSFFNDINNMVDTTLMEVLVDKRVMSD